MLESLTINIESDCLRCAVTRGRRVIRWGGADLPVGAVIGGVVMDKVTVSTLLKDLLKSLRAIHLPPVISVSGSRTYYHYLSLPKMERALLDKVVRQDLEDSINIPQEQLYVTWKRMAAFGSESEVLVVASLRSAIDSIVQTAYMAGLKSPVLDGKPLALARLAVAPEAVIADVEKDVMHCVVLKHGRNLVTRTVPLSKADMGELSRQLSEEIEITLRLYESSYADGCVGNEVPVFLSGAGVRQIGSVQEISDRLQRPVNLVIATMECPADMPWPDYAVNVGLAMRPLGLFRVAGNNKVPSVNMLPSCYRPSSRPVRQVVTAPLLAFGVLLVSLTYQAYDQALARKELAAAEIKVVQEHMRTKQVEAKKVAELRQSLAGLEVDVRTVRAERNMLVPENPRFISALDVVYSQAGDWTVIHSVSHDGGKLIVSGVALDHRSVLVYVERLTDAGVFSRVEVRESGTVTISDDGKSSSYRFGSGGSVRTMQKGDTIVKFTIEAVRGEKNAA